MNLSGARMVELAAKVVLALVAIGCAALAYRYAEVAALRTIAPLQASKLAPKDAKALARVLGSRFDSNPEFKPGAKDLSDIRTALVAQPLEPKLLSIMGLGYEVNGNTKHAAEIMRVANRASRHDSTSGLYLIESGSASGDVKATLSYYNTVLSTQPDLNDALLPILSSAIAYPEVRMELRPYLQVGAKWVPAFLAAAAEKGSVSQLQALLLPLPKALLSEEYASSLASVLHRIAVEEGRGSALRFAMATIPGLSPLSLDNMNFEAIMFDKRLGLFAWTFPPNDGIQVQVVGGKSLQINADPLRRGAVAVRDFLLETGSKYQLVQRLDYGLGAGRINARWSADCITPAGPVRFWDQRLPTIGAQGVYRSDLTVPQDCKVFRLTLFADGPDSQTPSTLTIGDLLLARVN